MHFNVLSGLRRLTTFSGLALTALDTPNDFVLRHTALQLNEYLTPAALNQDVLGLDNWIDPKSLGPSGVATINVLDNRHISGDLHELLCSSEEGGEVLREYFGTLIELAWPSNAEFHLCCSEPAGINATSHCSNADFTFAVPSKEKPLQLAPHFLTPDFGQEQQEALTAALIAKFNVHEKKLKMELAGRLDLGKAGTRFMPREHYEEFPHELGRAWGNMFLSCWNQGHMYHGLCRASTEMDRQIGRDPAYFPYAMFTCSGEHEEMGCFSKNMTTNIENGCDFVAATGLCEKVCVAGFCGAHYPPIEGRGTTNVLYVYMDDLPEESADDDTDDDLIALKFALPLASFFILLTIALFFQQKKRNKVNHAAPSNTDKDKVEVTDNGAEVAI